MYNTMINTINNRYGLNIRNSFSVRDGFVLITPSGKFICKEVRNEPNRILFVHGAKEHLSKNGLTNQDYYLCTDSGEPYIIISGKNYIVASFVEGRECDFENINDVKRASNLLAKMHLASIGYEQNGYNLANSDLGKLPFLFNKRLKEIRRMEKIATRRKSDFDYLYLNYCGYFYELGKDSLEYVISPIYDKLVADTSELKSICHNDLTYKNIILNDDKESESKDSIINYDFCSYDLKVYDLANLIRRRMRKCDWNIKDAKTITDEYRRINELTAEDFYVMKIMLQFPQKFWRVSNRYYNSNKGWAQRILVDKLEETINEIGCHKKFLEDYEIII